MRGIDPLTRGRGPWLPPSLRNEAKPKCSEGCRQEGRVPGASLERAHSIGEREHDPQVVDTKGMQSPPVAAETAKGGIGRGRSHGIEREIGSAAHDKYHGIGPRSLHGEERRESREVDGVRGREGEPERTSLPKERTGERARSKGVPGASHNAGRKSMKEKGAV